MKNNKCDRAATKQIVCVTLTTMLVACTAVLLVYVVCSSIEESIRNVAFTQVEAECNNLPGSNFEDFFCRHAVKAAREKTK